MRYLLAVGLIVFVTTPALAAEFYVGQSTSTKKCDIYDTKPDGTTVVMVGTSSYPTRDAAKEARKAAPECKGNI